MSNKWNYCAEKARKKPTTEADIFIVQHLHVLYNFRNVNPSKIRGKTGETGQNNNIKK